MWAPVPIPGSPCVHDSSLQAPHLVFWGLEGMKAATMKQYLCPSSRFGTSATLELDVISFYQVRTGNYLSSIPFIVNIKSWNSWLDYSILYQTCDSYNVISVLDNNMSNKTRVFLISIFSIWALTLIHFNNFILLLVWQLNVPPHASVSHRQAQVHISNRNGCLAWSKYNKICLLARLKLTK